MAAAAVRRTGFEVALQGLADAVNGAFEARVVVVGVVGVQRGGDVAAGLRLPFDEAPKAEDEVAVFQGACQFAVIDVRRADAFVDVLCGEVVAQHARGARVAVLAAQAVKEGTAAAVERLDERGVGQREAGLARAVVVVIGVEEAGFGVNVVGKRGVGGGHVFLYLAVRQEDLRQQSAAAIEQGAEEDKQGVGVPRQGGVVGQRGVDGDDQRAEGDGAVAQADRAHEGEGEGHQQHGDDVGERAAQGELHRERGGGKGGEDDAQVFDAPAQAVVQIHQAAGDDAEDEWHGELRDVEQADGERGGADAEEYGQGGDEADAWQEFFHGYGGG